MTEPMSSVDNASFWSSAVARMSDRLSIPDLHTRHGLKKAHARFDEISKRLDGAYSAARQQGSEETMGAVVAIMDKMCADALLRDKLFHNGLLQRVMPLLEIDSTRHLALHALAEATRHGGLPVRQEIARHNEVFVKLMRDHADDLKVVELVVVTVAHATAGVVLGTEMPDPDLAKRAAIRSVLETTLAALRRPANSHIMLTHALSLLASPTQYFPRECKAIPPLLGFLTAMTRSKNINARAIALTGILRLPIAEAEPDQLQSDPNWLLKMFHREMPHHLSEILRFYGSMKSEASRSVDAIIDYQQAMTQALQDRDMYALGQKLADIIQRTEFTIEDDDSQTKGPGLPFARWADFLSLSAKALRAKGAPADLDAADIVEMKYLMIRGHLPDAIALGHAALKRNPHLAYAYYTVSLGANVTEGLRAAKKGLKCKTVPAFVRFQMLWRAISYAGQRGLMTLFHAEEGDMQARARGTAYIMSAWEDAKTFMSQAPPDSRDMLAVLSWYVLLTIINRGPQLSEDLRELEPTQKKMKTATEFMKYMDYPIAQTQLNLARDLIFKHYTKGAREWGTFVEHFDDLDAKFQGEHIGPPSGGSEHDLAEWLEKIDLGSDDGYGGYRECTHAHEFGHHPPRAEPQSNSEMVGYELYRCSWCGDASAVLRKCGGCGRTRYCDSGCQKSHWGEHKVECKGRSSS
ncbi:hypothetical protein FKP32DRAFT_1587402 [Trametes sanguinea]|nr:hypothetical protein FKP32DRAFT_1587402 [Trametes sanguinea]